MTENPTTTLGNYDLLADRGQQGISLSPSVPGEGLKISGQRPRSQFVRAAEKPQNPPSYEQQGMGNQFLINLMLMLVQLINPDNKMSGGLMGLITKAFGIFQTLGNFLPYFCLALIKLFFKLFESRFAKIL